MRRPATRLALGAIAAFAVLVYFVFTKDVPFVHGYRIDGVFASSNQLREGSPVRIAGVTVGEVVGFEPGPGTTRTVTLELKDEARPIHADATLEIRPRLFLEGGFYVQLEPGTAGAPELEDGRTIPLAQTSLPVGFTDVLSALRRSTRDGLRSTLRELDTALAGGGGEALARLPGPLAPALRDFAAIAEAARGTGPHDLSTGLESSSRLTAALASRDRELAELVTGLETATGALAAHDDALAAGVRQLDGLFREAPPQLELIDRALPSLTRLAAAIRPGLRAAPPVLARTAGMVGQLEAATRPPELPRLLALLRPSLRDLPTLASRLTELFPHVTPVTDCVRDRVAPVLEARLDDGHLSTGRPVWQDLVHGYGAAASASQSFDGNGPWLRVLGLAGERSVSVGSDLPGLEQLVGRAAEPIIGVRPQPLPPGRTPPFRPDLDCRDQEPVDLRARTGPPPPVRPSRRTRSPQAELERLWREVRAGREG